MKNLDPTSDSPKHKWPPNPYPGLRPFLITEDSDESLIFFGRKEQIHDLLDRLGDTHFMAVLGPSGCGKSSLVKAGLIPALDSGLIYHAGANWISAEAEPGSAPINNLAKAIADALSSAQRADAGDKVPTAEVLAERMYASTTALVDLAEELPDLLEDNTNLLILVDQFEEIFREDLAQRDEDAQLINLLLNVFNMRPEGLYVVITMRTDYLEQCATFHGLPEALNQSQYLTPRLNPQQLSDSITGPAELRHYGGKVEPKLARKILSEMTSSSGYDPDLLPLMQHALFWMWRKALDVKRAEGEPVLLTLELYQELAGDGGLQGVLSKRADDIFENTLSEEQQRIAECMFRLMSEVDDGARRRRRVTTPDEVASIADVSLEEARAVIDIFASDTVSFIRWKDDGTTLDITHESLIRKWNRFDAWALEERSDAEQYRDLERATEKWAEDNRATLTEAGLLRWEEFQQRKGNVKRWAARYGDGFDSVSEYLSVSKTRVEEYKARQQQFQEATEREKAAKQKMSLLMSAAAVVLVVAGIGFAGWKKSFDQVKDLNDKQTELTEKQNALTAKSEELVEQAKQLKKKSEEANEQRKKAEVARAAAVKARQAAEDAQDEAEEARGEAEAEAIQLKESSERNARLVKLSKRAITLRRAAIVEKEVDEGRPATALRLALDTKDIATKDEQAFHLALARAATAAPQPGAELIGRFGGVSSVRWREEQGGWAALWQSGAIGPLERPNQLTRPFPLTTAQNYVPGGMSPDGQQVLATTQAGTTVLIGAGETGQPIKLTHNRGEAVKAQFTVDGTVFAMLSRTKKLSVWEAEAGDLLAHLDLLDIDAFDLNQDGTLLVTASPMKDENEVVSSSMIRVWGLQPNAVFASSFVLPGVVTTVRLSADESSIAVGLKDGTLKLLAADGSSVQELGRQKNAVAAVAFDPASPRLASGGASGELHVWNLETGQSKASNPAAVSRQNIRRLEFSPDGQALLVSSKLIIQVLDPADLSVQKTVHSDERPVALSSDGSRVLSISRDGSSWLWDVSTGARVASIQAPSPSAQTALAVFSLDGTQVATTYRSGVIQISSALDGRPIRVLKGKLRRISWVEFNADGTRLVVRSRGQTRNRTQLSLLNSETGDVVLSESQSRSADFGFSPDGKWFFMQVATDTIRVWNAVTGEALNDIAAPKASFHRSLLFVKNGTSGTSADVRLITLERRKARLWDVTSGDVINQFAPHVRGNRSLAINADATVLMTLSREEAHLFDLRVQPSSRLIRPMTRARGKRLLVGVFDKDGGSNFTLFSSRSYRASSKGNARRSRGRFLTMSYWTTEPRAAPGQRVRQTAVHAVQQSEVFGTVQALPKALSWQSPRHVVALTSVEGRVQTWRVRRGNRSHALDGQNSAIGPLKGPSWAEFDGNGRLVVRSAGGLQTFELSKGDGSTSDGAWKDTQTIEVRGRGLIADLSPDGKYVAVPAGKTSPVVVKLETGEQFGVRTPETGVIRSAVFDKSGRKILTTHRAGIARLWSFDPESTEIKFVREFASQGGTEGQLHSGYFDGTGDNFVTSARTGEVSVWSVSLDQPLGTFAPSAPTIVYAVGFTADGNCVFLENGDGKIQLRSRENPSVECYTKYTRPKNPSPELAGYRLLHQAPDRDNQLSAVSGMSLGSSTSRHAVVAIYNRENGKPVAVWKVPRTRYAGWANWSHDGGQLAVPLANGYVHVLKRPELDTWEALIAYAERAAKPALLEADVERLELLDVDEVIRLSN